MQIHISKNTDEFKALLLAYEDAFDWEDFAMPDDGYLNTLLQNDDFVMVIAKQDQQVIGGLTAYVLHGYYTPKPMLYIYDFGIKKTFQNQGIGMQVLALLKQYAKDHGINELFVATEQTDNAQALAFYRKSGISEELHTVNFNYFLE